MTPRNSNVNDEEEVLVDREEEEEVLGENFDEDEEGVENDEGRGRDRDRRNKKSRSKKKGRSKKKRKDDEDKNFGLPKISDEKRREIRKEQRRLNADIDQCASMEDITAARETNNDLFEKVGHAREAVLDAENVDAIATKYVSHAESLVQVPRKDARKIVHKLSQKCRADGGAFDWLTLGREAGICFSKVPDKVRFLAGPLEADRPAPKRRAFDRTGREEARAQRQRMKNMKEVRPEQVGDESGEDGEGSGGKNSDKASAAERAMKAMEKKLKHCLKKAREEDDEQRDVDGVKFLFNPKSFTQTVENIFHFSFLIKNGKAQIGVRNGGGNSGRRSVMADSSNGNGEDGDDEGGTSGGNNKKRKQRPGLFVQLTRAAHKDDSGGKEAKQAVLSFTMRDWRRLCEAYDVQEGYGIAHRPTKIRKGGPITSQLCD